MTGIASTNPGTARPRVALVVGSGGLKCAASIGLWRVLRREGIDVDLLVGCSGGSIYTAFMALGYEPERMEALTASVWGDALPRRLHLPSLVRALVPALSRGQQGMGIFDDSAFLGLVSEAMQHATFADLRVPLHLMATDLETGARVILSEGSVASAIRASVAIPIWFRPWPMDGRLLVDGAVTDPMPVSVAIREGCDVIIAMGFEQPRLENVGSLFRIAGQVMSLSMNGLLRSTFAFYNLAHHAEMVPILPEFDRHIGLRDVHLLPYIIEQGARAAEAEVPYLRRLLDTTSAANPAREAVS